MDEKTEALRELFVEVTDADTVTETQEESRGSLAGDRSTSERLESIIERMQAEFDFRTSLDTTALVSIVDGFYQGESDSAMADSLDVSRRTVYRARLELHLIRDRDLDAPFDLDTLRDLLDAGTSTDDIATSLEVSESTVRRYRRALQAQEASRRVSDRYRSEFQDVLIDVELGTSLTDSVTDDGLADATDGMESNVSF